MSFKRAKVCVFIVFVMLMFLFLLCMFVYMCFVGRMSLLLSKFVIVCVLSIVLLVLV